MESVPTACFPCLCILELASMYCVNVDFLPSLPQWIIPDIGQVVLRNSSVECDFLQNLTSLRYLDVKHANDVPCDCLPNNLDVLKSNCPVVSPPIKNKSGDIKGKALFIILLSVLFGFAFVLFIAIKAITHVKKGNKFTIYNKRRKDNKKNERSHYTIRLEESEV